MVSKIIYRPVTAPAYIVPAQLPYVPAQIQRFGAPAYIVLAQIQRFGAPAYIAPAQLPYAPAPSQYASAAAEVEEARKAAVGLEKKATLTSLNDDLVRLISTLAGNRTFSTVNKAFKERSILKISKNVSKDIIMGLIEKNQNHLEILDLSGNPNVDNDVLNTLANSESLKKSLHTLILYNCNRVTNVSALGRCASLQELYLDFTNVTDVSALDRCASLQKLYLIGCRGVTGVSALANNQYLTIRRQ